MKLFVFRPDADRSIVGFCPTSDGKGLPVSDGPWRPFGYLNLDETDNVDGQEGGAAAILDGVARDGFYLTKSVVRVTRGTGGQGSRCAVRVRKHWRLP